MLLIPTSFTAGKKFTVNGVTYQPGDVVPNAVVKVVKHLSCLLSSRRVIPNIDLHRRRTKPIIPTPTNLPPRVQGGL